MTMKKFAVIALLAGYAAHSSVALAETVEKIVAIVNDEIITMTDENKYIDRLRSGGLTDDLLIPDEATKQDLIKDRAKLLQTMIDEKVIDSEVKRQNLSVPIERVEQEVRSIAKRNNVSRDELKAALAERGIEFSQYQDFIKSGLERQSLIEKAITSRIKITEDDVLSAYGAAHNGGGDQAYEFTLSHDYFQDSKSGGSAGAKERAEAALARLKAGEGFDRVTAETTEDPNYEVGGFLGTFKTGEMQKSLDIAVSKLAAGEFTNVLPTSGGFQIVKVNKKRLIPDPRTEKEREAIRASLYEKAYKRQFKTWLEQLHTDVFIRINK